MKAKGQSVVEFVLIAPVFFLFLFGILQLFYCAYISFSVQKAANSIAQQAASSDAPSLFEPHFQIITALFPLEKLNNSTLIYALSSKCTIEEQNNRVIATISYPMPIWVPLIGKIIGVPLNSSDNVAFSLSQSLTNLLPTIGLRLPDLPSLQSNSNVIWITFQSDCLNENTAGT